MNSELEKAILEALKFQGEENHSQHAYFLLLKSKLYLPSEANSDPEDPKVLFLEENESIFLPIFSEYEYLLSWAGSESNKISSFELNGIELLRGLGENVTLAFNPGQASYKEFNPDELNKLKTMVAKIQSLVQD